MGGNVTVLLGRAKDGGQAAQNELVPLVYGELHRVASSYLRRVNEVHLRLVGKDHPDYLDRTHFFGVAA